MTVTSDSESEVMKQRFDPSAAPPGYGGETLFLNKTWVAAAAYWQPCLGLPRRPHATRPGQPGKACRRSRREERAGAAAWSGVLSMHQGKACRSHRATRGAGTNAAVVCRRRRTLCLLVFKQVVG